MTDSQIKSLRNLTVREVFKVILVVMLLISSTRLVIPLLVNQRDDTLLAVAVLVAMATVLAVTGLLFDTYRGVRKYYRTFLSATKEQADEKVTLH